MEQRAHPDQFSFDRWFREQEIICVVYAIPAETGLFRPPLALGSLHIWCDAKMFFSRTHLEPPSSTSVQNGKPSTVWFVEALDGSDTSRTQVALDDYVDRGVVIPTKGQDAEFHKRVTEIILMSG